MLVPPPKPLFDVRGYGAAADGVTFDTAAIQKAIDACAGSGGSVYLAHGKFLSAPLVLKGKMTFYIDKDAVLLGSTRPADYPDVMPAQTAAQALRKSLLYAYAVDGLVLDGEGQIDGQGQHLAMDGKEPSRPLLLRVFGSTGVTVRNLTLRNPRMWTQVYSECAHLTIDHVTVFAPAGYCGNLDGMDICDSEHVVVSNCVVEAQDDGICLKCHGPRGLHDITVRHNTITDFDANGIKLGTATHGPIEQVLIEDNVVKKARFGGVCIESVDGARVRGVTVRGLELAHVAQPVYVRLSHRRPPPNDLQFSSTETAPAGSIDDLLVENVRSVDPGSATTPSCTLTGIPGARLGRIVFRNVYLDLPGGLTAVPPAPAEHDGEYPQSNQLGRVPAAIYVRHAADVTFERVVARWVKPDVRPLLAKDDAEVDATASPELTSSP